jgi:PDZ domain-containing protein
VRRLRDDAVAPDGLVPLESDPARRPSRLAGGLLTTVFVLVIIAAGLTFVPLPYVTLAPGPATDVLGTVDGTPVLTVEGAPTYPTEGSLEFTTVSFDGGPGRKVTVFEVLGGWLSPDVDVVPESLYFPPDATEEQVESENTALMDE